MSRRYRSPSTPATAELREKGSRFVARLVPAADEQAAGGVLEAERAAFPEATHHCWAWRLGWPPRERASDAGEPRGTAGPPLLRALQGAGLSDAVLVVTRWYGGVKLGKGGLVRAYGAVARAAVARARLVERLERGRLTLVVPYTHHGAVQRLVHPPEVEIVDERFGEAVTVTLAIVAERRPAVFELVASLGLEVGEDREPIGPDPGAVLDSGASSDAQSEEGDRDE